MNDNTTKPDHNDVIPVASSSLLVSTAPIRDNNTIKKNNSNTKASTHNNNNDDNNDYNNNHDELSFVIEYEKRVEPFTKLFIGEMIQPLLLSLKDDSVQQHDNNDDGDNGGDDKEDNVNNTGSINKNNCHVLDIGCGTGAVSLTLLSLLSKEKHQRKQQRQQQQEEKSTKNEKELKVSSINNKISNSSTGVSLLDVNQITVIDKSNYMVKRCKERIEQYYYEQEHSSNNIEFVTSSISSNSNRNKRQRRGENEEKGEEQNNNDNNNYGNYLTTTTTTTKVIDFNYIVCDGQKLSKNLYNTFHYVIGNFSIIFFPNIANDNTNKNEDGDNNGLKSIYDCLKNNGQLVMSAWGSNDETDAFQIFPKVINDVLKNNNSSNNNIGTTTDANADNNNSNGSSNVRPKRIIGSKESLTKLLTDVGFANVHVIGPIKRMLIVKSAEEYYKRFTLGSPNIKSLFKQLSNKQKQLIKEKVINLVNDKCGIRNTTTSNDTKTIKLPASAYFAYGTKKEKLKEV